MRLRFTEADVSGFSGSKILVAPVESGHILLLVNTGAIAYVPNKAVSGSDLSLDLSELTTSYVHTIDSAKRKIQSVLDEDKPRGMLTTKHDASNPDCACYECGELRAALDRHFLTQDDPTKTFRLGEHCRMSEGSGIVHRIAAEATDELGPLTDCGRRIDTGRALLSTAPVNCKKCHRGNL